MVDNEIVPDKAVPVEENLSNKISMASTANSSIFERTEVLTGNTPPCPGKSLILKNQNGFCCSLFLWGAAPC